MTGATDTRQPTLTSRSFRAIGTTATVVVRDVAVADLAERTLAGELEAIDLACSRFRADSELQMVARQRRAAPSRWGSCCSKRSKSLSLPPSAREARSTRPSAMRSPRSGTTRTSTRCVPGLRLRLGRSGRWRGTRMCNSIPATARVRIPRGVRLDLGSTAKALAADRAAARIAQTIGDGVLVSLGGDVAVAGPAPAGGWAIGIARESSTPAALVDQVVAITHGGLASSATSVRAWKAGDRAVHHIVDPRTGDCVEPYWVMASATGSSCVEANLVTTASLVWGEQALDRFAGFGRAARLVRFDGEVFSVNGWPHEGGS